MLSGIAHDPIQRDIFTPLTTLLRRRAPHSDCRGYRHARSSGRMEANVGQVVKLLEISLSGGPVKAIG
ncbi:unnamed protein product, partial [Tilletia controversa]